MFIEGLIYFVVLNNAEKIGLEGTVSTYPPSPTPPHPIPPPTHPDISPPSLNIYGRPFPLPPLPRPYSHFLDPALNGGTGGVWEGDKRSSVMEKSSGAIGNTERKGREIELKNKIRRKVGGNFEFGRSQFHVSQRFVFLKQNTWRSYAWR